MAKASDNREMKLGEEDEEASPYEKPSLCLLCGHRGPALLYGHWICDHWKNVVQAEALAKRRQVVKEGGGPSGL